MDFSHRHFLPGETIAAIATAPGEAAISIIRISGKEAMQVADKIFSGKVASYSSHTIHYGKILSGEGHPIDHVLLSVMHAPRTYTGEDTIEIHCHGGTLITQKVFERVLETGTRAARPGEFTLKAFLNEKMDLTQAEAVQSLISAQNDEALKAAETQLTGTLKKKIHSFQIDATKIAAILEAWVDFPEEDLEFASFQEVMEKLEEILNTMRELLDTFHEGKILSQGLSLCLAGSPNVGKSSLMNALLGTERAIVTDIPGTTRDFLEEVLRFGKLHFRLIDTAGMRETEETVEKIGVERSKQSMKDADLVLLIFDVTRPLNDFDQKLLSNMDRTKTFVLWNKSDVATFQASIDADVVLSVSAKTQQGLEILKQEILNWIFQGKSSSKEQVILTKERHKEALERAVNYGEQVVEGLQHKVSAEFVSSDMRSMLRELSQIIGTDVQEEILSSIFSQFCVGK